MQCNNQKQNILLYLTKLSLGIFISTTVLAFTSCDQENVASLTSPDAPFTLRSAATSASNVTVKDATAVLQGALSKNAQGLVMEISDAAAKTQNAVRNLSSNCGASFDTTSIRTLNNAYVNATYTSNWAWSLSCNRLQIPQSFTFTRSAQGAYNSSKISSDDSSNGNWTVGNLVTGTAWTFGGTYTRSGSQVSSIKSPHSFTSELTVNASNIMVNKSNTRIESGTASFKLTGSNNAGETFTFEGNIVFNGNGTATVTINGQTFEIPLN